MSYMIVTKQFVSLAKVAVETRKTTTEKLNWLDEDWATKKCHIFKYAHIEKKDQKITRTLCNSKILRLHLMTTILLLK